MQGAAHWQLGLGDGGSGTGLYIRTSILLRVYMRFFGVLNAVDRLALYFWRQQCRHECTIS